MASRKKRVRSAPPPQPSHLRVSPNAAPVPAAVHQDHQSGDESTSKSVFQHLWSIPTVLLVLVLLIGFYVRIETLQVWRKMPQNTFFQDQPLLMESDGYYYLRIGRDLVRGLPETGIARPSFPPLLSVLTAAIARIPGTSFTWIGSLLAPMIGILAAFPVYFTGRRFGGPVVGLVAALATLLAPFYSYRTNFAYFSTDGLVVLLSMSACYFALRFGTAKSRIRYLDLAGWGVSYLLLLWAWGNTIANATLFCLPPFCVAVALFYRPQRKEAVVFFGALATAVAIAALLKGRQLLSGFRTLVELYVLPVNPKDDFFPTSGFSVSEIQRFPFAEFAHFASGNVLLLAASFAGLVLLIRRYPKELAIFAAPIILGFSSYFLGARFIIFLTPMMALGLGYLVHVIISRFGEKSKKVLAGVAAVLIGGMLYLAAVPRILFQPTVHPAVVAGMKLAGEKTPAEAILWALWDQGYPLQYWAERDVVAHGGAGILADLAVYNSLPLATNNFRLSANFMKFYEAHGADGMEQIYRAVGGDREKGFELIKEVLGAGPEQGKTILASVALSPEGAVKTTDEWLHYLFPSAGRPLYLFLDFTLTRTADIWYWSGTWRGRQEEGRHPLYMSFQGIRKENDELLSADGLQVNLATGEGTARGKAFRVGEFLIKENDKIVSHSYGVPGSHLEILAPMHFGAVMDEQIAESVFNVLFVRQEAPTRYFVPVALDAPFYQLWEVHGDAI
jgi:hypothetical protein